LFILGAILYRWKIKVTLCHQSPSPRVVPSSSVPGMPRSFKSAKPHVTIYIKYNFNTFQIYFHIILKNYKIFKNLHKKLSIYNNFWIIINLHSGFQ
jgi:hypothetical protein